MEKKYSMGRRLRHKPKGEIPRRKTESYLVQIAKLSNLHEAFKKVKENKGSKGTDGITIEEYERDLTVNLERLSREITSMQYQPAPLRKVTITNFMKKRTIAIPTVNDRVAQQAVLNIIDPTVDKHFLDCSYGYRKGKSSLDALEKMMELLKNGNHWIVKGDITGCFDNIPHEELLSLCNYYIKDRDTIRLIKTMIKQGLGGPVTDLDIMLGTPQGAVISPLLANIYLHQLDEFASNRGFNLIRYADDWVMLFKTEEEARRAEEQTLGYITGALKLSSRSKDTTGAVSHLQQEFNFLGYTFYPVGMKPSSKAITKLLYKLPGKIDEHLKEYSKHPITIYSIVEAANKSLRGWGNYFTSGSGLKALRLMDTRVREIIRNKAIMVEENITNESLYNKYGLISLEELYQNKWNLNN